MCALNWHEYSKGCAQFLRLDLSIGMFGTVIEWPSSVAYIFVVVCLFLSVKVIVPRFSYYDWMCAVLRN